MKYRKKPVVVEAITFDELVRHGLGQTVRPVVGMPWSFEYAGHQITRGTDDCYLILTLEGVMKFTRDDMLITGIAGEIYPCKRDIFDATYDVAGNAPKAVWAMPEPPEPGVKPCAHLVGGEDGWSLYWASDDDRIEVYEPEIPWPFGDDFLARDADMERAGFRVT